MAAWWRQGGVLGGGDDAESIIGLMLQVPEMGRRPRLGVQVLDRGIDDELGVLGTHTGCLQGPEIGQLRQCQVDLGGAAPAPIALHLHHQARRQVLSPDQIQKWWCADGSRRSRLCP